MQQILTKQLMSYTKSVFGFFGLLPQYYGKKIDVTSLESDLLLPVCLKV